MKKVKKSSKTFVLALRRELIGILLTINAPNVSKKKLISVSVLPDINSSNNITNVCSNVPKSQMPSSQVS